jgi:serine/threonine protein kinase
VSNDRSGQYDRFCAEPELASLQAGTRIAGYRLEEQIGRGGMAIVFRARDERLGRFVALKIPDPSLAADEAFRRRFIRESHVAAAVDDPHIIPVFEAGEADGVLFLAMRLVRGGDVRSLVRRYGPLPPERAAAIISPIASALDAAHAAGLVHRDVKPANMLLDVRLGRPDHVYLSDFGLSKEGSLSTGLTGSGQFLGSLDYVAPEQIEGRVVDGRADQYALACAAFEILSGVPPFQRDTSVAAMYAQLSEPVPPLTSHVLGLSPVMDDVFARALAKPREDRYSSCQEFADAARGALGIQLYASEQWIAPSDHPATEVVRLSRMETGMPTISRATPFPSKTKESAARTWRSCRALLAAAAAVVIIGGGVFLFLRSGGASPSGSGRAAAPAQAAALSPTPNVPASRNHPLAPAAKAAKSRFLAGNISLSFPAGVAGDVSLIAQGNLLLPIPASGESVPIAVRNNTSQPVAQITAQGVVHNRANAPVATGSDQGFFPPRLLPGQIAFGYVYIQGGSAAAPGSVMNVRVSATPSPSSDTYIAGLNVVDVNNTGQQIVGIVQNPRDRPLKGPYSVDAFCISASGKLKAAVDSFADSDSTLAPRAKTSFTVSLPDISCPKYLVGATGFDYSALGN